MLKFRHYIMPFPLSTLLIALSRSVVTFTSGKRSFWTTGSFALPWPMTRRSAYLAAKRFPAAQYSVSFAWASSLDWYVTVYSLPWTFSRSLMMSFQVATVPSTLITVFFVSSGCDKTATANAAALIRFRNCSSFRRLLVAYSSKLVNEIGAFPSPIMFALQFAKSRSNMTGTVKGNEAKLPAK